MHLLLLTVIFIYYVRDLKGCKRFYIIKIFSACFSEINIQELLSKLNDIVKSSDKNVRTRALWVISKQTFPTEVVGKVVSIVFFFFYFFYFAALR